MANFVLDLSHSPPVAFRAEDRDDDALAQAQKYADHHQRDVILVKGRPENVKHEPRVASPTEVPQVVSYGKDRT